MISLKINSCDSSAYSTRFVETNLLDGLGHLSLAQLSLFLSFQSKSEFLNKKNTQNIYGLFSTPLKLTKGNSKMIFREEGTLKHTNKQAGFL